MKTVKVWFIRHAESESNAGLPINSPGDINITEKGKEQAEKIAEHINQEPNLIVTSPFRRTTQTAKPTLEKFPGVQQEVWPIQEFTYLSKEHYDNSTSSQRSPAARKYFQKGDSDLILGEGAESFNQFLMRVNNVKRKIKSLEVDFTIIFGHGWFMRALFWTMIQTKKTKKVQRKVILKDIQVKMITSTIPLKLYSTFGLRNWKKDIHNFLLFSAVILIPNGVILEFENDSNPKMNLTNMEFSHIPKEFRGSYLVDR